MCSGYYELLSVGGFFNMKAKNKENFLGFKTYLYTFLWGFICPHHSWFAIEFNGKLPPRYNKSLIQSLANKIVFQEHMWNL